MKYCILDFYIIETLKNEASTIAHFKREIYIVDNLRAKMLIDTNIFDFEVIVVDVVRREFVIDSCDIIASLFVILKKERVKRKLRNKKQIIISLHTIITILVKYCEKILSSDRDYNFLSRFDIIKSSDDFFAYIIDANVEAIQIRNVFNEIFVVLKNLLIEELQNYNKNNCYLAYS